VIFVFSRVARVAARLFGGATSGQSGFISKDELRVLIDLSETASDSAATSKQRIRRIFRFADTTVGEVMTPLAEVIGFNETREMGEAVRRVWASGFNRLPVFRGNITNVTGVMTLSTWDLLLPDIEQRPVERFRQTGPLSDAQAEPRSGAAAAARTHRPHGDRRRRVRLGDRHPVDGGHFRGSRRHGRFRLRLRYHEDAPGEHRVAQATTRT
jgi:hypothetical protein